MYHMHMHMLIQSPLDFVFCVWKWINSLINEIKGTVWPCSLLLQTVGSKSLFYYLYLLLFYYLHFLVSHLVLLLNRYAYTRFLFFNINISIYFIFIENNKEVVDKRTTSCIKSILLKRIIRCAAINCIFFPSYVIYLKLFQENGMIKSDSLQPSILD